MKDNYGIVVKANPTKKQLQEIKRTIGAARSVYNYLIYYSTKAYKENSINELNTHTKMKKINRFKYLKKVDDAALASEYQNYKKAWKNYMKNPSHFGIPQYKTKKHLKQSYQTQNRESNNHGLNDDYVKLGKSIGDVQLTGSGLKTLQRKLKQGDIYKGVTVSIKPSGACFISFQMMGNLNKTIKPKTGKRIGIDVGQKDYMIYSNGEKYNPKFIKNARKYEKQAIYYQQKMTHKREIGKLTWKKDKYGRLIESNRYIKDKQKYARISQKIADMRKDHNFRHAKRLVDRYDTIVLESLDIKYMTQEAQSWVAKAICESAFTDIKTKIIDYAETQGKEVILANKFFPSSQLCHKCGYKYKKVSDDNLRKWDCPRCREYHDRDINAALNLHNYNNKIFVKYNNKYIKTKEYKEYLKACNNYEQCKDAKKKEKLSEEKKKIKKSLIPVYQEFLDKYHQEITQESSIDVV